MAVSAVRGEMPAGMERVGNLAMRITRGEDAGAGLIREMDSLKERAARAWDGSGYDGRLGAAYSAYILGMILDRASERLRQAGGTRGGAEVAAGVLGLLPALEKAASAAEDPGSCDPDAAMVDPFHLRGAAEDADLLGPDAEVGEEERRHMTAQAYAEATKDFDVPDDPGLTRG